MEGIEIQHGQEWLYKIHKLSCMIAFGGTPKKNSNGLIKDQLRFQSKVIEFMKLM